MGRFTDEEVRRYARQIILPEVGGIGQERLRAAHALADDEVEALYLAAAGVGTLTVPTAEIAAQCQAINPGVIVRVADPAPRARATRVEDASVKAVRTLKGILGL